jgi:hypothetical protein
MSRAASAARNWSMTSAVVKDVVWSSLPAGNRELAAMHSGLQADCLSVSRAIFTCVAIHPLTSDSSQPTARGSSGSSGSSGTGFGKAPSLTYYCFGPVKS